MTKLEQTVNAMKEESTFRRYEEGEASGDAADDPVEHGGLLVIVRILSAGGVPEVVTTRHRRHHTKERTRSLKKQ